MAIEFQTVSRVIVPRKSIGRLSLSCPHANRLAQCNHWAGLDRHALEIAVRNAQWEIARRHPTEFQQAVDALNEKLKTLASDPVWLVPSFVGCKLSYIDHMLPFLSSSAQSILAFGLRDSFQNLFKFVWQRGQSPPHVCRPCEPLTTRQYPALYSRVSEPGRLRGGQATFTQQGVSVLGDTNEVEFAIVAPPLVEVGRAASIEKRVGFQSDLRHEFRITPSGWKSHLPALQQLLFADDAVEVIGDRVIQEASRRGLREEDGYYLSSVGVRDNGDLILVSLHGSVSSLAQEQLKAGAVYALLTEEGGSCATAIWQNATDFSLPGHVKRDVNGNAVWQPEPVIFGHNSYFRPAALVLCVVELNEFFLEAPFVE